MNIFYMNKYHIFYNSSIFKLSILLLLFSSCEEKIKVTSYPMKVLEEGKELILNCQCEENNKNKNGLCKCFDKSGNLIVEEYYVNDIKHGEQTQYYENGQMKIKRMIVNGVQHGILEEYYESGQKHYYRFVKEGKIIYEKEYDQDGNILTTGLPISVNVIEQKNEYLMLDISLDYSMYDSVYTIALLDNNNDNIYEDTILSRANNLTYQFPLRRKNKNILSGILVEIDAGNQEEVGEGIIYYEYTAAATD